MKIVCFHLNQIGDLMFSLPALKSLREGFDKVHITSVVRPGLQELLHWTNLVDDVLVRDGRSVANIIKLLRILRRGRYDVAISFSQSAQCALLAYTTRAPTRLGFVNTSLGFLLTKCVSFVHPPSTANNLRLVETLGVSPVKKDYFGLLTVPSSVLEQSEQLLASRGVGRAERFVVIAPETSKRRRLKEWIDEGFAEVAKCLTSIGLRAIVVGAFPSPRIADLCSEVVDLGGQTSIAEVAGILARCETLVGVDSGILHLCAAMGKPVVGLYGPTNPEVTGPQGEGHIVITSPVECSPCKLDRCPEDRMCMKNIDPNRVVSATLEILRRGSVFTSQM
jgi:ADP-heptose:LPS heptosyltransferase